MWPLLASITTTAAIFVPALLGDLVDRLQAGDPGVIHQDGLRPAPLFHLAHRPGDPGAARHVGLECDGLAAQAANYRTDGLGVRSAGLVVARKGTPVRNQAGYGPKNAGFVPRRPPLGQKFGRQKPKKGLSEEVCRAKTGHPDRN
jgi:hypothetical protein